MGVGERLRELREAKGLSQAQLAEIANVPQKTISNVEQGVSDNPAWKTMLALAEALGVDCTALVTAEREDAEPTSRRRGRPRKVDNNHESPSAKSKSRSRKVGRSETPRRGGAHPDFPVGSTVRVRPMGRSASQERRALIGRVGLVVESSRAEVLVEFPGLPVRHPFQPEELDPV
jgi:transcriptional regulator with XRE-family HTH domain